MIKNVFRKGIALGIILLVFGVSNISLVSSEGTWWNENWSYSRVLPISNPSNSYQMKIVIGKTIGGHVNCNGHCKDDFSDIRFVDVDNTTVLSYWTENINLGNQATFWVKLPSDVETDGAIILYYGNPSANSLSDGSATFLTFIDNTDGWTGNTEMLSMEDGRIKIYSGPGPQVYHTISTGGYSDISVDAKIEEVLDPYINYIGFTVSDGTGNYNDYSSLACGSDWNFYEYIVNDGSGYTLYSPWSAGKNREWRETVRTSVAKVNYYLFEEDGSLLASAVNQNYAWSTVSTITHIRVVASVYRNTNAYISWIRVRNYVSSEPSWGTPGEEHFFPLVYEVSIDIKPGSYPNSINPKSNGKIPVAILTTEDFDASQVAPNSINFLDAVPSMWSMDDVDKDGDIDMILHFKINELNFSQLVDEGGEYLYAYLSGETIDDETFFGKDTVNLIQERSNSILSWIIEHLPILEQFLHRFPFFEKIIRQIL
ncbi:MAG: DUF2341 domain-containing protein [Asgard group archaeon]|nr:DUF2341 domain-containing protein [Asgard group archaeon]